MRRLVLMLLLVFVAGCGGGGSAKPTPSPTFTAERQVLASYEAFWTQAMPRAAKASGQSRKSILARSMTGPALTRALRGFATLDRTGRIMYGRDVPLRQSVRVSGTRAVVKGCLDSSGGGAADKQTGRKLTRGVRQNPVTVELVRGPDGVWRVTKTTYGSKKGC